jgi:hypothetical protein
MSFLFGVTPRDTRNAQERIRQSVTSQPIPEPGIFKGVLDTEQILNTLTKSLEVEPAIIASLAASNVPRVIDSLAGTDLTSVWHENVTDPLLELRDELKVNPTNHGAAAQILDSIGTLIPQAIVTGAVGTGIIQGITETTGQVREGKDLSTASQLGAVTGLTNAIGIAAPASLGVTLPAKVVTGAALNIGFGSAHDYAKNQILSDAGYTKEAEQYKWNDARNRTTDAILGAFFGGVTGIQKVDSSALFGLSKEVVDSALAHNQSRYIDNLQPGIPISVKASNDHAINFNDNLDRVLNGDPVKPTVYDANNYIDNPAIKHLPENIPDDDSVLLTNKLIEQGQEITPTIPKVEEFKNKPIDLQADEFSFARQYIQENGDIELSDGENTVKASDLIASAEQELNDSKNMGAALKEAINCFLSFGGGL